MVDDDELDPLLTHFACADCKVDTYVFGAHYIPLPSRCGLCTWIAESVPDPVAAATLRERAWMTGL